MESDKQGKGMIQVNPFTRIPVGELWFEFSHASGPGGQNVNKVSSRVTVCFSPASSSNLTDSQKRLIAVKLRNRINQEGVLKVSCDESRSQSYNRELVLNRLRDLLAESVFRPKQRKKTRPTLGSRERRLKGKKHRSQVKQDRQSRPEL